MNITERVNTFKRSIGDGFELRSLTKEQFEPLFADHYSTVFGKKFYFDVPASLSQSEKDQIAKLTEILGSPLCLRFGLFHGEVFVGWHIGDQHSREEYYMRNSGVLPEFRGRGLYTAMLKELIIFFGEIGFQVISSKHNATNNRVMIPKLKAGFIISGMSISDRFGTLVRLEYFTNPIRRSVMDVRCGQDAPSESLKPFLGL